MESMSVNSKKPRKLPKLLGVKNLNGGRKNEKSMFRRQRAQVSSHMDHCQVSAVRYCSGANRACNGSSYCNVCYYIRFAINEKWR